MISWIQKTFQRHFRLIFLGMLAVIVVPFVFTFGPSSGIGQGGHKTVNRTFFGLNLGSAGDQQRLVDDAGLSVMLQAGYNALQGEQFQQYAFQRYAALHLAEQLHLPGPTDQEIAAHVQTLRAFAGQDGKFDAKTYATFRDSLKTNPRIHESDVLRVISDDVTYNNVQKLLSGPGYVLPGDVKNQLIRADSLWTIASIDVDYASFNPAITPAETELAKYFEDNSFRYEIAPKVSLDYLDFPAADFLSKVTVTDTEVRAYYDANAARFPAPSANAAVDAINAALKKDNIPAQATSADADFAAVRPQVEAAVKLEQAKRLAAEASSDVSVALYEGKVTAAGLDAFLAARKLSLKSVAPFDHDNVPAALAGGAQVADEAFKLGADRRFSDVVSTSSGAAILVWKETIPARKPAFTEVKARVTADYLENEKRRRFVELGQGLRTTLAILLKLGTPVEKAVESARATTAAKLSVKTWPAFTLATPPKDIDYSLYGAIESLQKGGLSQMIISGDKGIIAYAIDKQLPDLDPAGAKFTETRAKLARYTASRDASEYLGELVERELAKSAPAVAQ
jgi:peptidyl-prolyl cis-trans isomerase D